MSRPAAIRLLPFLAVFNPILALLLAASPSVTAAEWKGTRTVRDGVTYVANPAEPMEPPKIYDLKELWRLSSEGPDGELVFGVIHDVIEDEEGNLYALDSQLHTIHVISPAGEYLRSLGREGEGPGEFTSPSQLFWQDTETIGVVDVGAGKIILLTVEGHPAGEWRAQPGEFSWITIIQALPTKHGYALSAQAGQRSGNTITSSVLAGLFDRDGKLVAKAAEETWSRTSGEPYVFDEVRSQSANTLCVAPDGGFHVAPDYLDYEIHKLGPRGQVWTVITTKYEMIRRDAASIKDLQGYWRSYFSRMKDPQITVSEYEQTVQAAILKRDNSLWVVTSRSWADLPPGVAEIVDVYDGNGRFTNQVVLRKHISPEDDLVYHLEERVIIVTGGISSNLAAVGAGGSEDLQLDSETSMLPSIIACEMVAAR